MVLSFLLNVERSLHSHLCSQSEFQREGAAKEKAMSPKVRCLVLHGSDGWLASDQWSLQDGVRWWSRS